MFLSVFLAFSVAKADLCKTFSNVWKKYSCKVPNVATLVGRCRRDNASLSRLRLGWKPEVPAAFFYPVLKRSGVNLYHSMWPPQCLQTQGFLTRGGLGFALGGSRFPSSMSQQVMSLPMC